MTLINYEPWSPSPDRLQVIRLANAIIAEYAADGFTMTLRQLYYQFVQRGLIDNSLRSYKNLGDALNRGRLAGLVPWDALEDRTRNLRTLPSWAQPSDFLADAPEWFHHDLWDNQPRRVEVWIEKDALVGVIVGVCQRNDVPYYSCRGYSSQSEQWRAGQRLAEHDGYGQEPVVLHLGDHDPSGIDMTRDNERRLELFAGVPVEVRRLALNYDQVEQYALPPNPTKTTDSRTDGYVAEFGRHCWELDALRPQVIVDLIQAEIDDLRDPDLWDEAVARQESARSALKVETDRIGGLLRDRGL